MCICKYIKIFSSSFILFCVLISLQIGHDYRLMPLSKPVCTEHVK